IGLERETRESRIASKDSGQQRDSDGRRNQHTRLEQFGKKTDNKRAGYVDDHVSYRKGRLSEYRINQARKKITASRAKCAAQKQQEYLIHYGRLAALPLRGFHRVHQFGSSIESGAADSIASSGSALGVRTGCCVTAQASRRPSLRAGQRGIAASRRPNKSLLPRLR